MIKSILATPLQPRVLKVSTAMFLIVSLVFSSISAGNFLLRDSMVPLAFELPVFLPEEDSYLS